MLVSALTDLVRSSSYRVDAVAVAQAIVARPAARALLLEPLTGDARSRRGPCSPRRGNGRRGPQ
jgi:hypothetical protein